MLPFTRPLYIYHARRAIRWNDYDNADVVGAYSGNFVVQLPTTAARLAIFIIDHYQIKRAAC